MSLDPLPSKEAFGRRVYRMMLDKGMTQSDLARAAGLERNRVSTYVRGVSLPTGLSLTKLANALGVKPTDLLHDARLADDPAPYSVTASPDGTKARVVADAWVPAEVGAEINTLLAKHAFTDRS